MKRQDKQIKRQNKLKYKQKDCKDRYYRQRERFVTFEDRQIYEDKQIFEDRQIYKDRQI